MVLIIYLIELKNNMKTINDLIKYIDENGKIVLYDTLGCQKLINLEKKTQRIFYLEWWPRENSGFPKKYIEFKEAMELIERYGVDIIN